MRIVIVTGLSGAGKTTALRSLEDIGFFCVDNLPLPLWTPFVELIAAKGHADVALSVDARQHQFLSGYRAELGALRRAGHSVEVLFLEAPAELLQRRYSETRRRHPMAGDALMDGIRADHAALAQLREDAEGIVDTSNLNVHQLRGIIQERYGQREGKLAATLVSFGFKHGLPAECDDVFDVRFLPNPYFVEALSGSDGRNPEVAQFVLGSAEGEQALAHIERFVRFALPHYRREGKLYLTIGVGCTGGRHRSVAVVEELARRLRGEWDVFVRHRDLRRGTEDKGMA